MGLLDLLGQSPKQERGGILANLSQLPELEDSHGGLNGLLAALKRADQYFSDSIGAMAGSSPLDPIRAVAKPFQDAVTLPRDVYEGKVDPRSDEGIQRAFDAAGTLTLGAGAIPAEANSLRAGIKAYHGSPHEFERFDMARAGSTTDPGALGRGLYFSDDPSVLKGAKHGYEAELDLKNPLVVQMPDFRTRKVDVISRELGIEPPKHRDEMAAWSQKVADMVKERGHDAVILDNSPTGYNGREIAVFDDKLINITGKH